MKRIPSLARASFLVSSIVAIASAAGQTKPPIGYTGCAVVDPPGVRPMLAVPPSVTDPTSPVVPPGPPGPPEQICLGDIGAAVSGGVVDPSLVGITMNLLGDGFRLSSLTLRAETQCGPGGGPLSPVSSVTVLDTTWGDPDGQVLSLSQRPAATPQGNFLDAGFASFWWNGYFYSLSGGQPAVLAAIAQLAPGLDPGCFFQRTTGAWEDLAKFGIGDPRPAIPTGFSQTSFDLQYLKVPGSACPSSPPPADDSTFFSAAFSDAGGGMILLSASSLPAGVAPSPGSKDDFSVSWSNLSFQFGVFAAQRDGSPLPSGTLAAIALRLDPAFGTACFFQSLVLEDSDLPALGFHAAIAPAGYESTGESLYGYVIPSSCATHYEYRGEYSFYWSFANSQGLGINASAIRTLTDSNGPRTPPVVTDACISWNDDVGTSYSVFGYSFAGGVPDINALVAVAQSMDPGLTIPK